jgi:peptidase C39-like protein
LKKLTTIAALVFALAGSSLLLPDVRSRVRAVVRPEPPPRITPLAVNPPAAAPRPPTRTPRPTVRAAVAASPTPQPRATPTLTPTPAPSPTPTPIVVGRRVYDAYIPAATKEHQAYRYSCEFDAAWVILQTYGVDASVDELIGVVGTDKSIEPFIEQTRDGFVIHGGDITKAFSGNYRENFLARSSGDAMRKAFEHYGLDAAPVHDRAGVEEALRRGALIWIKTTVDFKPWRPAIWLMPDGRTHQTVLGNDHAVVVIGFNADSVVIRDVLGPTSTNWQRPYEYEVDWPTFLAAWGAQEFDGLAVSPPTT